MAHERDVLHRDINPNNIVVAKRIQLRMRSIPHTRWSPIAVPGNSVPSLIDFGLAILDEDHSYTTLSQRFHGTDPYVAPECAGNSFAQTPASDVYGLSASLLFMALGEIPEVVLAERISFLQFKQWQESCAKLDLDWQQDLLTPGLSESPDPRPSARALYVAASRVQAEHLLACGAQRIDMLQVAALTSLYATRREDWVAVEAWLTAAQPPNSALWNRYREQLTTFLSHGQG